MGEPTLNDMGDYNKLSGEKRKVVFAVILSGLIIGTIFVIAKVAYGPSEDAVQTGEKVRNIPLK